MSDFGRLVEKADRAQALRNESVLDVYDLTVKWAYGRKWSKWHDRSVWLAIAREADREGLSEIDIAGIQKRAAITQRKRVSDALARLIARGHVEPLGDDLWRLPRIPELLQDHRARQAPSRRAEPPPKTSRIMSYEEYEAVRARS